MQFVGCYINICLGLCLYGFIVYHVSFVNVVECLCFSFHRVSID